MLVETSPTCLDKLKLSLLPCCYWLVCIFPYTGEGKLKFVFVSVSCLFHQHVFRSLRYREVVQ